MPKPIFGENGSGMHTHQSLFRGDRNAFYDANDPRFLSKECYAYIAGLLKHGPEITLVTNQWINSYKRLVPGYEAPVYLSWALRNRSDLIRVPAVQAGQGEGHAHRVPRAGPGLQPVPGLRGDAGRGPGGHRAGLRVPGADGEQRVQDARGGAQAARASARCRRTC